MLIGFACDFGLLMTMVGRWFWWCLMWTKAAGRRGWRRQAVVVRVWGWLWLLVWSCIRRSRLQIVGLRWRFYVGGGFCSFCLLGIVGRSWLGFFGGVAEQKGSKHKKEIKIFWTFCYFNKTHNFCIFSFRYIFFILFYIFNLERTK